MSNKSLRKQAYQHILGKILSGDWSSGVRISELALADETGISRTLVRGAIREGVLLHLAFHFTLD